MAHHRNKPLYFKGFRIPSSADYYSKYIFAKQIPSGQSNTHTVVKMLRQILSEQGIPKVVRSDNGPNHRVQAFQDFAREFGFQRVTNSPNHPQSNGSIESLLNSVSAVILKAKTTHINPESPVLEKPHPSITNCNHLMNYFSVAQSKTTSRGKFPDTP